MAAPSAYTPNVISLVRVSTNRQDVARQRSDIEKAKRKFNLNVSRVVELVGVSGVKTFDHAEIKAIIAQIENDPSIDGIQISALDRLFRPGNSFKPWQILEPFLQCHKKIWTNADGLIDLDTDEGMDKATAIGHAAGVEWRRLKQRSADGRAEVMDLGRLPGGTPRYGWDYLPYDDEDGGGHWVVNEREAEIAREWFRLALAGRKTYAIAAYFNERGVLSKGHNGKPPAQWSRTTGRSLLTAREYIGEHLYGGQMFSVPRIIDDETFIAVQALLAGTKGKWVGAPGSQYLLRNFLFCSRCNQRCVGHSHTRERKIYRCDWKTNKPPIKRLCDAPQVYARILEAAVWSAVWGLLTDPTELLVQGRAFYDAMATPDTNQQQEQRSELETLKRALANKIQMCDEGFKDIREEGPKMREIRSKIAFIEGELNRTNRVRPMPAEHEVQAYCRVIAAERSEDISNADRRDILEGLDNFAVHYADGKARISGAVPVPVARGGNREGCLDGTLNSTLAIPFNLEVEIPAAVRDMTAANHKAWVTRRKRVAA